MKDKNNKTIQSGSIIYGLIGCGNHWGVGVVSQDKDLSGLIAKPAVIRCTCEMNDSVRLDYSDSIEVIGNVTQNEGLLRLYVAEYNSGLELYDKYKNLQKRYNNMMQDKEERTVDKAVLKELLDNWNCHNEDIRKTINTIKFKLRFEEEE